MNTTTQLQTFIDLENQYWQAMRENDADAAVNLTHFPCLVAGPQGVKEINEAQYRSMMSPKMAEAFKDIQLEDVQVRMLNDQTAIVTYYVHMNGMKMLDVSTWVQEGERWTCAFHSENPLH